MLRVLATCQSSNVTFHRRTLSMSPVNDVHALDGSVVKLVMSAHEGFVPSTSGPPPPSPAAVPFPVPPPAATPST